MSEVVHFYQTGTFTVGNRLVTPEERAGQASMDLSESYKVYDEAADYVADFDADDRDMKKYIIGTIGSMNMPMEAVNMGARSFHAYFLGKTEADIQKVRDQVLSCTQ